MGLNLYFPKDSHQNMRGGGSVRSDIEKLDFFTLKTSKNPLILNFLRNGRVRVKISDRKSLKTTWACAMGKSYICF